MALTIPPEPSKSTASVRSAAMFPLLVTVAVTVPVSTVVVRVALVSGVEPTATAR